MSIVRDRDSQWPVLCFIALMVLGVLGLLSQSRDQAEDGDIAALNNALSPLMLQGQSRGYQAVFQQYKPAHVWALVLHDREGQILAAWPPPVSQARWRLLAQPLQSLRQWLVAGLGQQQQLALTYQGQRLGELQLYSAPHGPMQFNLQAWLFLGCLLCAALGVYSLYRGKAHSLSPYPSVAAADSRAAPDALLPQWASAMDEVSMGLVQLDQQARVQFMNTTAQQLSAWSLEEARGLPAESVLRLRTASPAGDEHGVALEPCLGASFLRDLKLYGRNDKTVPLNLCRLPFSTAAEPSGSVLLLRSVRSEHSEREQYLQEAQLAEATLDVMGEGLAMTDRYGRISRTNRKLQQLSGYSAQELQGMTVAKLMPVPFLNDARISLADFLPSNGSVKPSVLAWRKDATTFAVELQVQQLPGDEPIYLLLISDKAQRQRNEKLACRLASLLENSPGGLLLVDPQTGYCNAANPSALSFLGYTPEKLKRMSINHLITDSAEGEWQQQVEQLKAGSVSVVDSVHECRLANAETASARVRLAWSGDEEPPVLLVFIDPD